MPFPAFPDDARLWIYTADRVLSPAEQATLQQALDAFFATWRSHGRVVRGAAAFQDDRFLLITATLDEGDISGCGIDASVHALDDIVGTLGIGWLSALDVLYRDHDGAVVAVPRKTFRRRVREGLITAQTPVFDASLATVGALREGRFEQPAGTAWHAQVFRIPQLA